MKTMNYVSPQMDITLVDVEGGFTASLTPDNFGYGGDLSENE